jgi:hypothetical protein
MVCERNIDHGGTFVLVLPLKRHGQLAGREAEIARVVKSKSLLLKLLLASSPTLAVGKPATVWGFSKRACQKTSPKFGTARTGAGQSLEH